MLDIFPCDIGPGDTPILEVLCIFKETCSHKMRDKSQNVISKL